MPSCPGSRGVVALAAIGIWGCGRLADDSAGEVAPLGLLVAPVVEAGADQSTGIPPGVRLALFWRPRSSVAAMLGAPPSVDRAPACVALAPEVAPSCDGTAASGLARCTSWPDAEIPQPVTARRGPLGFEVPLRDPPPAAALVDLSAMGGRGTLGFAALRAFVDEDGDGRLRYGRPRAAPERVFADSAYRGHAGAASARTSSLLAFRSSDARVPAVGLPPGHAALATLGPGFGVWIEEEWRDAYGRPYVLRRVAALDEPLALVTSRDIAFAPDWCEELREERQHLPALPAGSEPGWCSESGARAAWRASWRTDTCTYETVVYEGDYACATEPPPWSCPAEALVDVSVETLRAIPEGGRYGVLVDGVAAAWVGAAGDVKVGTSAGVHRISLDLPASCSVVGEEPGLVSMTAGAAARVHFEVSCLETPRLRVTTVTTGDDLDDAYVVRVSSASAPIGANASIVLVLGAAEEGAFAVHLDDVAWNCAAADVPVWLAPGTLTEAYVPVQCGAGRGVSVTTATTGVDLDPDGFGLVLAEGAGAHTFSSIPATGATVVAPSSGTIRDGRWQARLTEVAPNCEVTPSVGIVEVVAGNGAVAFEIRCGPDGQLAYTSSGAGAGEIFLVGSNGTGATNLTRHPADDRDPAWSPDGSRLAFSSDRDGNREIYVMNADGSSVERLTANAAFDGQPAWSPDGARIAFVSDREGRPNLWVMDADGAHLARLTSDAAADSGPAWSPDGTRIAFSRGSEFAAPDLRLDGRLHVVGADGTGATRVTAERELAGWPVSYGESGPAWSPDGTTLAYGVFDQDCSPELMGCVDFWVGVVALDGGIDAWPGAAWTLGAGEPAWSPDGRRIAFATPDRWWGGTSSIRVARSDGTTVTIAPSGHHPAWRPAGAGGP